MFYNAFGNLEKKERNTEHFTISDIRYKNTKHIDNKDDPLYAQYYEDKKAREENVTRLDNLYSKDNKIGINNMNPIGTLTVGDSSKVSDGNIVIGKRKSTTSQNYKLGMDDQFWFTIGSNGNFNKNTSWKKSLRINKDAPDNSLTISNRGLVGLGTSNPYAKLTVDSYADSHIQRLRNKIGYYDLDIQKNSFDEDNVLLSTDTKKFNFQKPVSTETLKLESEKKDGKVEIRMIPNDGLQQLPSVKISAQKEGTGTLADTSMHIGRTDKSSGKDIHQISYLPNGNIGIGTTNPQAHLHVVGDTALQGQTFANNITLKNDGTNWYHRGNGDAAIVNANDYNTLMIVGRESSGARNIGMWDNVSVSNNLNVGGKACFNGVCIQGQDLIDIKNAIADIYNKLGDAQKYFVKHGDLITIKSTDHGGKRLQNANGPAKFENHNRLGYEKMIMEKCGLPGIGDNKNCG